MENFEYYGIFLLASLRRYILGLLKNYIPQGWSVYAEHCTLLHCSDKENAKYAPLFESLTAMPYDMHVIAIGKSEKALALKVEAPSCNKVPHITIAVAPGAKPADSNYITDWRPLPEGFPTRIGGIINKRVKDMSLDALAELRAKLEEATKH